MTALTVLYFGDSLTAGSSMTPEDKPFVWPNVVEQSSQGKFRAINEGVGGRPTDSILDFQSALKKHGTTFDLLVISLGSNDARDLSGHCVPNALKNLRQMIQLARAARPGIPLLLVGPANIRLDTLGPTKPVGKERDQNLRDLNAAYPALAKESSCAFVSLYDVIPPKSLAMDGVHPDAAGNRSIATQMLEALERLVSP